MGNPEAPAQTNVTSNPSPAEPALLRFTEALTGIPDAKKADGIADMLLIFLTAGGTILGVLTAAMLYLFTTAAHAHTGSWIFQLLVCVGAGGIVGCLGVMTILRAKDLIDWERR
jgi:hypothetical protein